MDRETVYLLAGAVVALGAAMVLVQQAIPPSGGDAASADPGTDTSSTDAAQPTVIDSTMSTIRNALGLWQPPAKYAQAIADAEAANGIPSGILARLLWQESRYKANALGPMTRYGQAQGMAQFLPDTAKQFGIDPMDPFQAIAGAGRYLGALYRQFGTWAQALAAYNWGPGNLARQGLGAAPAETRHYYASILSDVNSANGTALT